MYKKGSLGKEAGGDEKFGRGLNKLGEISERNEVSLIFKAYVFLDLVRSGLKFKWLTQHSLIIQQQLCCK